VTKVDKGIVNMSVDYVKYVLTQ